MTCKECLHYQVCAENGIYFTDEYINERKDGKETVFNMVTSMFGCMYLSGRIDKCDEYNFHRLDDDDEIFHLLCNFEDVDFDKYFTY